MSDDPSQPRQPKNTKDLLRYCTEVGSSGESAETNLEPLSEERRRWLNEALASMTVDHVAVMRECLSTLQNTSSESYESDEVDEKREQALEQLQDICENLDFANDFHKIGGFEVIAKYFSDPNPDIRSNIFELIAALVQNNPYCQEMAVNCDWLSSLIKAIDQDEADAVKIKAFYALSCLVRHNSKTQSRFTELDGFSVIMRAMQSGVEKLKIKSAFLLSALINEQPSFKDVLCDIGMVDQLVGKLREKHDLTHEHVMSALLALATDHARAVSQCRRPQLNLGQILRERIAQITGYEEYSDERRHAQNILDICFKSEPDTEQER